MSSVSEVSIARKRQVIQYTLNSLRQVMTSGNLAYGYNLWISDRSYDNWLSGCAKQILQQQHQPTVSTGSGFGQRTINMYGGDPQQDELTRALSPIAFDLLWRLCTMNVLRPGIRTLDLQSVEQGQGYSITGFGKRWLETYTDQEVNDLVEHL